MKTSSKSNPYENIKKKSRLDWHAYYVWEDPNFQKDLKELISIKKTGTFNKTMLLINKIMNKYEIDYVNLLVLTGAGITKPLSPLKSIEYIDGSKPLEQEGLKVVFSKDITREEYEYSWNEFNYYRQALIPHRLHMRKRGPEDPRLVYAVYRAKQKMSYVEIFGLYKSGRLPMYEGKHPIRFDTADDLRRYYLKYRPGKGADNPGGLINPN